MGCSSRFGTLFDHGSHHIRSRQRKHRQRAPRSRMHRHGGRALVPNLIFFGLDVKTPLKRPPQFIQETLTQKSSSLKKSSIRKMTRHKSNNTHAPVAQLVECRNLDAKVVGSKPTRSIFLTSSTPQPIDLQKIQELKRWGVTKLNFVPSFHRYRPRGNGW